MIDTPLFAQGASTHLLQVAELCAYSIRRYYENGEERLFSRVAERVDRRGVQLAGVMHYTGATECACRICASRASQRADTLTPFRVEARAGNEGVRDG